ncbi:MAG: elongation factor G, partial [Nitrososphaerota archaeon]
MNVYRAQQIRNVAVIAHGGSGKTSLMDAALFDSGAVNRIGKVDEESSISDYDPDEIKRHQSINLTVVPVEWRSGKINLLDTPGYPDFVGEVMAALRVADAALVVVSAEKGVEVGTELVWRYANKHDLPRMVFVNKLDRENTSYDHALESLRSHFGTRVVPLTIPIGEQAAFSGVVDLVAQKAYSFSGDKATAADVPADMADAVRQYREQLVETAVESDDDLMNKYLEGEEVTEEELRRAIKTGVAAGQVIPVLAGSAAKNIGVHTLLDAMTEYLPSAADRAPADVSAAPVAFVFKTLVDPQKGTQSMFRVYQGTIRPDSHLYNVNTGTDERLAQLLALRGKLQETMSEVSVGDIATVVRLNKTHTGDTLGAKDTTPLPPINFPAPVYTAAVHPKTQSDLDKLGTALSRMLEEDRTLHVDRDQETAEMLLSGMG